MKQVNHIIAITILSISATLAIAQNSNYTGPSTSHSTPYTGPSAVSATTVKQLLANGKDDGYVTLIGKIVQHDGGENYTFSDASGTISVEIPNKYFPANQKIDHTTKVEIHGKFDKDMLGNKREVEVKSIKILPSN